MSLFWQTVMIIIKTLFKEEAQLDVHPIFPGLRNSKGRFSHDVTNYAQTSRYTHASRPGSSVGSEAAWDASD